MSHRNDLDAIDYFHFDREARRLRAAWLRDLVKGRKH